MKTFVNSIIVISALILTFSACNRAELPTVQTISATSVTEESATLNGQITSDGNGTISQVGFMFGTASDLSNARGIFALNTTTNFSVIADELVSGRTYYYQAFATNEAGSAYGEIKSFTASSNYNVNDPNNPSDIDDPNNPGNNGNENVYLNIYEVGELYAKIQASYRGGDDTLGIQISRYSDFHNINTYYDRSHDFYKTVAGLSPNTTYYCRPFLHYNADTTFYETRTFTTTLEHNYGSFVDDRDGNVYRTVSLGEQTWMAENLRYLPYLTSEGSYTERAYQIAGYSGYVGYDNSYTYSIEDAKKTCIDLLYDNVQVNSYETLGTIYSRAAAFDIEEYHGSTNNISAPYQGVCPTGWHLPTYTEWNQLFDYLSRSEEYSCSSSTEWLGFTKSMAMPFGWNGIAGVYSPCSPSFSEETNNRTGFSVYPGANRSGIGSNNSKFFSWDGVGTIVIDGSEALPYDAGDQYPIHIRCVRD